MTTRISNIKNCIAYGNDESNDFVCSAEAGQGRNSYLIPLAMVKTDENGNILRVSGRGIDVATGKSSYVKACTKEDPECTSVEASNSSIDRFQASLPPRQMITLFRERRNSLVQDALKAIEEIRKTDPNAYKWKKSGLSLRISRAEPPFSRIIEINIEEKSLIVSGEFSKSARKWSPLATPSFEVKLTDQQFETIMQAFDKRP